MVAPQVPTCWPVRQAVLNHEPHGEVHHAVGILTAGWCQIGEVHVKVLATLRTIVLRIGDHQITRTPHVEIPQVVQRPPGLFIPVSLVRATWTGLSLIGAAVRDDLWRWQVCNGGNPFGGIGSIRTRTEHGCVLPAQIWSAELYDKCPSGARPKPGKDAIVSVLNGDLGGPDQHVHDIVQAVKALPASIVAAVVSHSDTVGRIVQDLGGDPVGRLGEQEFDKLFVLFIDPTGLVTTLRLRYGAAT